MLSRIFSWVRAFSLLKKEFRQMIRDRSTITLGIVLPIILLLLFGYGLSFDVQNQSVAIVKGAPDPFVEEVYEGMRMSKYFTPQYVKSQEEAEKLLIAGKINAIVRIKPDTRSSTGTPGHTNVQVIVNGADANTARIMERYIEGAIALTVSQDAGTEGFLAKPTATGGAVAIPRVWYNPEGESRYFLVPGVLVIILTMVGSMLTGLVVAREWERGTYEALIATSVTRWEILFSKTIPYFALGCCGMAICLFASRYLFQVPMRSPLWLIVACCCLYLVVSLVMGLTISAVLKSQFLASQVVLLVSFLPTLMLSGFIFDLNSAPAWARFIAMFFPGTWFVDLILTLFLVGDVPSVVVKDVLIVAGFSVLFSITAALNMKKSLE